MGQISGIDQAKLARHGGEFLKVVEDVAIGEGRAERTLWEMVLA